MENQVVVKSEDGDIKEVLYAKGSLSVVLLDEHGKIKDERFIPNLVVTVGLAHIIDRLKQATATVMSHMALGSGVTAAAAANTALQTELGAVALDSTSISTTNVANDSLTYIATFGVGVATGAVTEAGIRNSAGVGTGTLLCRTTFAVVNKGANDTIVITWKVTLA